MNKQEEIDALEFLKTAKTSEEIRSKFGAKKTADILREFIPNEYIKKEESNKFILGTFGDKRLDSLNVEEKKSKIRELAKHPLLITLITFLLTIAVVVPLTAHFTHQNTISSIDYQKTISLSLLDKQELTVKPEQDITFNGLTINNPTGNKVALKGAYILGDENWQRWNRQTATNKNNSVVTSFNETSFDTPRLQQGYQPYMELESHQNGN